MNDEPIPEAAEKAAVDALTSIIANRGLLFVEQYPKTVARTIIAEARPHLHGDRWRLLYTGARKITDRDKVYADLDSVLFIHPRLLVRHGAAREGGDLFAVEWVRARQAQGHDVIADPRPAPWPLLGKIAGPMRNAYMAGLGADECLAHILDGSTGSSGTATFAKWAGIPTTTRKVT